MDLTLAGKKYKAWKEATKIILLNRVGQETDTSTKRATKMTDQSNNPNHVLYLEESHRSAHYRRSRRGPVLRAVAWLQKALLLRAVTLRVLRRQPHTPRRRVRTVLDRRQQIL